MLDKFRKGQRWLTAIFIAVIGVVFVFFLGLGGPVSNSGPAPGVVVQLGDVQLDTRDYARTRQQQEQRLQQALGEQFDSRAAAALLDAQALRTLVDGLVLSHAARELGFGASNAEIKEILLRDPSWRDAEGRFDQENFDATVRWEFGSQKAFLGIMERQLLAEKIAELLSSQAQVTESEAREAARFRLEKARIAWVALGGADLPADAQPDEAAVSAYLASNEEAVRALYEERSEVYAIPEQIRLRHILFEVPADADEGARAEVRSRAEAALKRLEEGAVFAELASELSEDPNSKENGGDLGLVRRGDSAPPIETAAFALEIDVASAIVEGPQGLHILLVEEKIAAGTRSFDDVKLELAREGAAQQRADEIAAELVAAVEAGESLEAAARSKNLILDRTGLFSRRRDGFIPGLGASEKVMDTTFALTMEKPSPARVYDVAERRVMIQLLERHHPNEEDLAAGTEAARIQLLAQRRNQRLQNWIDAEREALIESNQLQVNSALVASGPS